MGTKFTVYDNGTNPCKNPGALLEDSNTRQELAAICYVSFIRLWLIHHVKLTRHVARFFVFFLAGNQRAGIQRASQNDRNHPGHEHEL